MQIKYILAPYLETPPDVVERMLDLAGVQPLDVVYDIGCGDGRVAIAAAVRGAHCLGVDAEPYWVEQSRQNALAADVAHLVRFEHLDATQMDLGPASVIFMYLVHWSTQMIAKAVRDQCAPGTRVVSHSFPFTAVPTTLTESFVDAGGKARNLYLWVKPGMDAP